MSLMRTLASWTQTLHSDPMVTQFVAPQRREVQKSLLLLLVVVVVCVCMCACMCVALPLNYSAFFLHPGLLLRDRTPGNGVILPISSLLCSSFSHKPDFPWQGQTFPLFLSGEEFPSPKLEDQIYQARILKCLINKVE